VQKCLEKGGCMSLYIHEQFGQERWVMVETQIRERGVNDSRVLEAMRQVPRHLFVDERFHCQAYEDHPVGIGEGQTVSQPYIIGLMLAELHLNPKMRVLEIGTGSGYTAAVMSLLVDHVYSIEWYPSLAEKAKTVLKRLGYSKVSVVCGDGSLGLAEYAPYDAICMTASTPAVAPQILEQLRIGGRLIAPVGESYFEQELRCFERFDKDHYRENSILPVRFVSLQGKGGWGGEFIGKNLV
jgi:protein-L-isoaspartate(D-aspartate) O-methyltransferase